MEKKGHCLSCKNVSGDECVRLYDASNIDQFQWPDTQEGRKGRDYLYPIIKEGVKNYLHNVRTDLQLVVYKDIFLPITVNEKEYGNSYIASNFCAIKLYEESLYKRHPSWLFVQKPFLLLGEIFLKWFKVNQTIFINNWLITSSLLPSISSSDLAEILHFLKGRFPRHTLIFRNVDTLMKKELLNALLHNKFHLLKTRNVFFYKPGDQDLTRSMRKRSRKDWRIVEKLNFERVDSHQIQESDYPRLLTLYEMLYIKKYTQYSPQYSLNFIKNTHQNHLVTYVALKREGIIEGFFSYFSHNGTMINCLFGYDTTSMHAHELYKILTRLVLEEADRKNLILNDGSGGDSAKLMRGLKPFAEYMALYNTHLPLARRLFWDIIALCYKKIVNPKEI